jgi:YfiH family protein
MVETCPLLNELPWIRHGFFDKNNPCADAKKLVGIQKFNNEFPETLFLRQTHSDYFINDPQQSENPADAAITDRENLALAIKTADCCPVLLVCTHSKQIAAIHAGWRGALNNITTKVIDELIKRGAKPETMIAAIGPSIFMENFPVQDDVRDQFPTEAMKFFVPFDDRWKMDVTGIVKQQLVVKGVNKIWQSPVNTYTDNNYFSYRRFTNGLSPDYASNISIISKINP